MVVLQFLALSPAETSARLRYSPPEIENVFRITPKIAESIKHHNSGKNSVATFEFAELNSFVCETCEGNPLLQGEP